MKTICNYQVATFMSMLGYIPYIIGMIRGIVKPNRITWILWTFIGAILLCSQCAITNFEIQAISLPVLYLFGPLMIALLSLKYGESVIRKFDVICAILATIGLLIWPLMRMPEAALIVNIAVDFFGAIPSIRKSLVDPASESLSAWIFFQIGNTLNLISVIENHENRPISLIYPIYMGLLPIVFIICILLGYIFKKNQRLKDH